DTDPYEEGEGFEVREDDGGKILKGRVDLAYEMGKQVEIFYSEEYQEARASAGNEFPQDSGWEMPTENEGGVFGLKLRQKGKVGKLLDVLFRFLEETRNNRAIMPRIAETAPYIKTAG
ncbi:hypothetical protein KKF69_08420, partial [Patescibacteria group bacterium]|nr:hypothetical protein [Patescibacteria group bacterium]